MTKNEKNWQNPIRLMKISEIWYVDASQQKKCYQKQNWISAFFGRFLTKKQPKLTQNEENLQNLNCLMNFSEIWYVDASQQQKMLQKNIFWTSAFFGRFLTKKQPKLSKNEENWQIPNCLMKFSEIWYVDASQQNKMLQKNHFRFQPFLAICWPKKSQNCPK